jgi:hypothetical protein
MATYGERRLLNGQCANGCIGLAKAFCKIVARRKM